MGWCRQKFSKKNQAIWAKNEPQKMASLTAGGTCSCIIVECTKNTLHNVIQLYKFNWMRVQALVEVDQTSKRPSFEHLKL